MKLAMAKEGYRKVGDEYLLAKKCTKCGKWLVANTINFHRQKIGKYELQARCKKCISKYGKQYRQNNKEKEAERHKQYYEANKEKLAEYHKQWCENNSEYKKQYQKQWYEANRKKVTEHGKQWYEANKEKLAEYYKQYYQANKEKVLEYNKQYRENNKDKIVKKNKQYYEANKDKIAEYHKQWRETPQGQIAMFNAYQRRRTKEEQLGGGITKDQWLEMMSFFGWRCAYSGKTLTKDTRSIDHIVPLNSNGDNMIWNCVPMKLNYNRSKRDKDMLEWYREQSFYSEARLEKIYKWQEYAYNKYGKNSEYFNSGNIQITLLWEEW